MKKYQHLTELDPVYEKALKAAKEETGLPITKLLTLCVRKALPLVVAQLKQPMIPDPNLKVDWSDFYEERPRRKGLPGRGADEIRELERRR